MNFNKNTELESVTSLTNNYTQSGGGLLNWVCGNDIVTIILQAAKKGRFDVVSYLVLNQELEDLDKQDEDGYTVLHYIVSYYHELPDAEKTLTKLLSSSEVSDFINLVDFRYKNTALHLATMRKNYAVANKLVKYGANVKAQNKEGMYVATESEKDISEDVVNTESVFRKKKPVVNVDILIDGFLGKNKKQDTNSTEGINMTDVFSKTGTDVKPSVRSTQTEFQGQNTSEFVNNLMSDLKNYEQVGGVKSISGSRVMNTMSNLNYDDNDYDAEESEIDYNMYGGADPEASKIHTNAITKIMSLMKVDKDTANVYRATVFYKVVTDHPEIKGDLERAVEMEKNITKDMLDSIDIEKEKREREKRFSMKQSKKGTSTSTKSSDTSSTVPKEKKVKATKAEKPEKKEKKVKAQKRTKGKTQKRLDTRLYTSDVLSDLSESSTSISM